MTNLESREWVEGALRFWTNKKPSRHIGRKLIQWNIERLTVALRRLP